MTSFDILIRAYLVALAFPILAFVLRGRLGFISLLVLWALGAAVILPYYLYSYFTSGPEVSGELIVSWTLESLVTYLYGAAFSGILLVPASSRRHDRLNVGWVMLAGFFPSLLISPFGYMVWALAEAFSSEATFADTSTFELYLGSYMFVFVSPYPWGTALLVTAASAASVFIVRKFFNPRRKDD
ncbi:hypothetical protein [Microvirga solisilvae]|uniref:hypothetical protein n=1 Tax=Microvirga solisilvae TaxID=2919498 RepID=UPI001FAF2E45|nr:hypothetical protein [Microvirga solisilvae]